MTMARRGRRRLYLMRHGHVDYFDPALEDPRLARLTEEGREQAAAAGRALSGVAFDLVAHSGLQRTRDTAGIVLDAAAGGPPILEIGGLEELKSGLVKAGSREELAARLAFCFEAADAPGARFFPDGELFVDAQDRVVRAIEELILEHDWGTALVVAHEGVNRILLGWACGAGLGAIDAFEQDLCCINVLDADVTPSPTGEGLTIERVIIKAMNVTPYDYLKAGLPRTSLEHLFGVDFEGARPRSRLRDAP